MFQEVTCKAYMKKINDGRYINVDRDGNAEYVDTSRVENDDVWHEPVKEEDYDGSPIFLKTHYTRTEKSFVGMVVGLKMVTITNYIVVETRTDYRGSEHTRLDKIIEEQKKCALVYYGCNKSRLVPLEDLEVME